MKSMADSVAFPPQPSKPLDAGVVLGTVNEAARKVKASTSTGNDDLKQRSIDSANVIKIPRSC